MLLCQGTDFRWELRQLTRALCSLCFLSAREARPRRGWRVTPARGQSGSHKNFVIGKIAEPHGIRWRGQDTRTRVRSAGGRSTGQFTATKLPRNTDPRHPEVSPLPRISVGIFAQVLSSCLASATRRPNLCCGAIMVAGVAVAKGAFEFREQAMVSTI